jgi:spore germination protein GerM
VGALYLIVQGPMRKKTGSKKKSKKKTSKKTGGETIARIVIFLFLAGMVAGAVFLLKNPGVVIGVTQKDKITKTKKKVVPAPLQAPKKKDASVHLYFLDPHSDFLVEETRVMIWEADQVEGHMRMIIEALLKGPKGDALQAIPPGVVVRDITLKGEGLGVIDFSGELSQNHPGGSLAEMHTIYSIVNSLLLNIPSLNAVQILVEGEAPETLKGHIDCRNPFKADRSLIKTG